MTPLLLTARSCVGRARVPVLGADAGEENAQPVAQLWAQPLRASLDPRLRRGDGDCADQVCQSIRVDIAREVTARSGVGEDARKQRSKGALLARERRTAVILAQHARDRGSWYRF